MASSAQAQGMKTHEIQAAVAKSVELRTLHAALLNGGCSGGSPAFFRLPAGVSPSHPRPSSLFSGEDYPVFAPSYERGEALAGYQFIRPGNRSLSENWSGIILEGDEKHGEPVNPENSAVRFSSLNSEQSFCPPSDHFPSHPSILQTAQWDELLKSTRRTNSGEFEAVATANKCKPSMVSRETECTHVKPKKGNSSMPPLVKSQLHPRNRSQIFSWLLPKLKKKAKSEMSPKATESEDMSQILKEWGVFSLESLNKALLEANESRDAALADVAEMRSSLGKLKKQLVSLESYCEELKKALTQAVNRRDTTRASEKASLSKRTKSVSSSSSSRENSSANVMPVSHEVMVEGFLQMVSESRLSLKQFCKTLVNQIEESDGDLMDKINQLLHPHRMTITNKYSKGVLYHLEALISQCLYQDFENCVFQKDGAPKVLDPQQDRQDNFSAFVSLRNLSWNDVLRKGTKYYSEDFSRFCDQKMGCIVSVLNWSKPWSEELLQSFFVTAKCIWLLHLLAFSFNPPLAILRVDENRGFDPMYMEDVLLDRQQARAPARVKIMVMPGFYVQDKVLRCRVLCRYHSVAS